MRIEGEALNALRVNGQACPARVEGECLEVDLPMAERWRVEFAWQDYYEINLYNAAGIPALPFRGSSALCSIRLPRATVRSPARVNRIPAKKIWLMTASEEI